MLLRSSNDDVIRADPDLLFAISQLESITDEFDQYMANAIYQAQEALPTMRSEYTAHLTDHLDSLSYNFHNQTMPAMKTCLMNFWVAVERFANLDEALSAQIN